MSEVNPGGIQPPPPAPPQESAGIHWRQDGIRLLIVCAVILTIFAIAFSWDHWIGSRREQVTDDAYLQTDLIPLSARVSGYVRTVTISDYATVRAGQTIVTLVDDDYQALVEQSAANVAAAQAQLQNIAAQRALQQANIESAAAVVAATEATLDRNEREARRQQTLVQTGAGTAQYVEQADTAERSVSAQLRQNRAQWTAAKRQLDVLEAQRSQALASLKAQEAALAVAKLNLQYTHIEAPASGMVGVRLVKPGQFVAVGQQVMQLATLPNIWVIANYKETQMARMRIGQAASVEVDAFNGHILKGHIDAYAPASGSQFALLPPDNATGNFTKVVQRLAVKIVLDGPGNLAPLLRPGMSVTARVDTNSASTIPQTP